jgi:hypothetical protein
MRSSVLRAGDVESNPGPDRGPCVVCGLMPAENARALLRCREGCGRECHYKKVCSGLGRGEQHQGNWACGICVVVDGGWLPPIPNLIKCRPRRHLANPLVKGLLLVNLVLLVRPNHAISRTSLLLWGVLCRRGARVGPVVPSSRDGGGGGGEGLALGAALVLELGFPLMLGLGLAPGIGPNLYPSIPWWRHTTGHALLAT